MGRSAGMVEELRARAPVAGAAVRLLRMPRGKARRAEGVVPPTGVENRDNRSGTGSRDTGSPGDEGPTEKERRAAAEPPAASRHRVEPVLVFGPVRSVSPPAHSTARDPVAPALRPRPRRRTRKVRVPHRILSSCCGCHRSRFRSRGMRHPLNNFLHVEIACPLL
jgi:hypothetical protein